MGPSSVNSKAQQSDHVELPDGRTGKMITIAPFPKPLPWKPSPKAAPTHKEAWIDQARWPETMINY
jgi:hypothetical protein